MISYQICATDVDGTKFVIATLDDLHQARKRFAFIKATHGTDDILFKSPHWRSIELYRVEMILSTRLDLEEELR